MIEEFDPKKSYMSIKAHEKMLAFTGFLFQADEEGAAKEGVLKISANYKPYGGGQLTLTFVVDAGVQTALKDRFERAFSALTPESLGSFLGQEMTAFAKVPLDKIVQIEGWDIEEVSVHFRRLRDYEKTLLEQKLIPALEKILAFKFQPIEWWPLELKEPMTPPLPGWTDHPNMGTFKSLFRKLFDW
ncbi:MAG: hypothetical protein QNI95_10940 [Desulfobacterales bacterium]|nr:hypothetical protein [Desulfobacterales bacterium]